MSRRIAWSYVLLGSCLLAAWVLAPAAATNGPLTAHLGVTVVRGDQFPVLAGTPIARLRLLAADENGQLHPIPFQIDERDAAGYYVLPNPLTIGDRSHLNRKFAARDADGGKLDANDELAFRPADAGAQVNAVDAFAGIVRASEICLTDKQNRRGCVYLVIYQAEPPALDPGRPVRYDPVSESVTTEVYIARYRPGRADISLSGLQMRLGDGVEILDRVKTRLVLDPIIGPREFYDEDMYRNALAGYVQGPVRTIRVSGHDLNLGPLIDSHLEMVTYFTREAMSTMGRMHIPVSTSTACKRATLYIGADLTSAAAGMQFYPSRRTPLTVDGRTDAAERALAVNEPTWMAWAGHGAVAYLFGRVLPPHRVPLTLYYLDDARANAAPEDEPGAWGQGMFQFDLSAAKKGSMDLFFGMSFTPGAYRAGGEEAARAMFAPAVQASVTDLVL